MSIQNHRAVAVAVVFLASLAPIAAHAKTACGVQTHERFGETRAFFSDVLAACMPDGDCKLLSEVSDRTMPAGYKHQLRLTFEKAAPATRLSFVAVEPMADMSKPTSLQFGRDRIDLTGQIGAREGVMNEYGFTDSVLEASLVDRLIGRARSVVWTFAADGSGAKTFARFPLRGAARARAWIACMQAG